eukprot:4504604-Pyramimonas_sp.AAC.1
MAQDSSRVSQESLKTTQDSPRRSQDGPRGAQNGPSELQETVLESPRGAEPFNCPGDKSEFEVLACSGF